MRVLYGKSGVFGESPRVECEEEQTQLQRTLADKISSYASTDELRMLLVSGAKADGVVTLGLTPLHYACHRNYFDAAKLLIVRGAKVDAVDEVGYSALHLCAEKGMYSLLKMLLEHLANRNKCVSFEAKDQPYPIRDGADEPLRLALWQRHFDCAKLLLEMGADPNTRYFDGPQITLVEPRDYDYVKLLLDFGANPNVTSRKGVTPLMKACEGGQSCFETTKLLLQRGANPNSLNLKASYPMTALHYAVGSGHVPTIRLLLECGAKQHVVPGPNEPNARFPPVLHFGVMSGNAEVVRLLLEHGADLHSADGIYGTALHLAACFRLDAPRMDEMVEVLLRQGADPNRAVLNPHGVLVRAPVVEFFRRLYKFHIETGEEHACWARTVRLLFEYGARLRLSPEELDVRSMAIPTAKPWPSYADQLARYLMGIHERSGRLDQLDQENSMYLSAEDARFLAHNPRPLVQLCRTFIRSRIRIHPDTVLKLPISNIMRDYLLGRIGLPFADKQ